MGLHQKDLQEKHEIFEEFLQLKQEELQRQRKGNSEIDNVDLLAAANFKQVKDSWISRLLFGKREIEIPHEIETMPYEQRKALEQVVLGDSLAVNYNAYPFKGFGRKAPQFFIFDQQKYFQQSDTAKFVKQIKTQKQKQTIAQNERLRNRDLRILN